ncbi:hypothetical protein F511_11068 [Dorcoceras hygrometricum]|uniref:Uncharacterized protein n=1 Tax=Dorcoceras hygrometricum TaxID=472368 RepID=A0A2Z7AID1_9LAMI|nr:hypothetical protein F511_11068 [Dorcoceras hygrometricum]
MLRRRVLMTSGYLREDRAPDRDLQPQNTSSEGAGDVSGEAPPMLKSGDINTRESSVDSRACGKASVKIPSSELYARIPISELYARILSSELYVRLLIAFALDDVGRGVGGGEMVKRLTKAHQKMNAFRDQFDKVMGQHAEVLARLEELETLRSREEGAAKAQREALEAQLMVEREAHEAEKAARELLEAELEEVKARATQEAERLKNEGKEEFLKSLEFDTLLGKKAGGYFKNGFLGCVGQWRANGYPEEEHSASFLNVQQAIVEMADEEEAPEEEDDEDEEGEEGGDGSDATPPRSPLS